MPKRTPTLDEALERFARDAVRGQLARAAEQRQAIIERFSLEHWSEMSKEEYAVGQESKENFCWFLEFGSLDLGSIAGGSSAKLLLYKRKDGSWYYEESKYGSVEEAWGAIRDGFVRAFAAGNAGNWDGVDRIGALHGAPALRAKALHIYFPDDVLAVYAGPHLLHFLKLFGVESAASDPGQSRVILNRELLKAMRETGRFDDWSTVELAKFLYWWADPRQTRRIVKIAPGEDAYMWDDCLANGYIRVGWEETGDLREIDSKDELRERFLQVFPDANRATATKKTGELWALRDLEAGDIVVANQGTSKILAIGEVIEPLYEFREELPDHNHVVNVDWDTSFEQAIEPQKRWAFVTVDKVAADLYQTILRRGGGFSMGTDEIPAEAIFLQLEEALERKGQVILYGPPGTGKTYVADRFSNWWMDEGDEVQFITFHPSYSYEDFIEGYRPSQSSAGGQLSLTLEDGIFKRLCRTASAQPDRKFILIVDEINRANIAKVFGELVTLIEKDKRGRIEATLAQSRQRFTVPPNVYLIGTMNTADRSIKLLDVAVRRRFAFVELMPDPDLLKVEIQGLALDALLDALNATISRMHGREKQLGHALFLTDGQPISDAESLAQAFRQEVIPLLQEYCYEDYSELATYLGADIVDAEGKRLNRDVLDDPEALVRALQKLTARQEEL